MTVLIRSFHPHLLPLHGINTYPSKKIVKQKLPSRGRGTRFPSILGLRQINTAPPIFEMFIKNKTSVHFSYVNYVANRLREQYGFFAAPIIIKLTKMKR